QAALLGRCGVLRTLCEACHAMSYIPDEQGRTLLHYAACSGDAETMAFTTRVLGYDAAQGDCAGVTPLDLAKERGEDALRALEEISGIRLADCYRNPVRRGFWPDPSILRVGEEYWMVNSTFAMVPALPISRSRDLVHWETVGHVFTDPDTAALSGLPGGYGYWAPDISYYQGRFWVVATLRRDTVPFRLQMITSASSPQGPWDAPRFLPVDGIDPSLFTDDDGKRYLVVNPGVQIARISDAGELLEQPRMIFLGWNKHKSEGPHILKKDGWYYIFQAEGGTGQHHLITCSRARSLEGPYESCPFNPILGPRQADAYIGRGGHGKPVALGDGRWAIPYLCGRKTEGKTLTGRETALDPLEWTADGWPMVNGLRGPSCLQRKPLPDHPVRESSPWMCPRADHRLFAAFEDGAIRLAGGQSPASLRDAHLLLHRQREAGVRQRVIADVSAMAIGGMAGLAGYYDENSWYLLGLRRTEKGAEIVLWERVGAEDRERPLGVVSGFRATLEIEGEGLTRRAACAESGERAAFRVEYLTDEGLRMGKRFTGATLGLAAVGAGQALLLDYFEEMTP
ncbi:MAG: family 43 glycosylhydrolase, partial [Clostridia bacterium]|nr:family 43 glycosylhydrolase [Clostridia bacterium]